MALRSTAGFTLGVGRFLAPLNAQLSRDFQAFAGVGRDEQPAETSAQGPAQHLQLVREQADLSTCNRLGMGFAAQAAQQPAVPLLAAAVKACSSRSSPLLPARPARRPLLPGMPRLGAPADFSLGQRRAYNAWSPAQRYFVEGDHVVAAEANRAFQFTGLDGGSFFPYVVSTIVATAIATVFIVLPLIVAPSRVDLDKSSAYECGFDAFGEARQTFSVSFYLVSIMYLLFDIEIAYLFPYAMTHASLPMYWTMNLFLAILVAGFAYEWGMGALEWRE
ncbi:hypothetical protein HYH03_011623 [Edaphochlamys debaryana]|uniref:NADH-ubiquinone oxidoreductase chain 3 n=1 Tax=Edaphochlamys debaryana TaxID=47281 RepID=A0A835XZX9_9CHLO|nr:hypothetical protein HYH03_011623 [Edaphochlamys debaryana]|eukprot:KAG2489995.1 hypothetical protein HYH03_011623 [Edaphochlamys debaryana]